MTTQNRIINIAYHLRRMAGDRPYKRAVVCPSGKDKKGHIAYSHLTFLQLDRESDKLAFGLSEIGIRRGVRTILMVKPSLEFFALTFALFKVGAVPVVVDPGMGVKRMLGCLKEGRAEGFVGIPKAHMLRKAAPGYFHTVKYWVTVGRRLFWGGRTLDELFRRRWEPYPLAETTADETAAILFTTGSTGPAKGVVYTHGNFDAQIRHIQAHFRIGEDEIDLPTFPLFALFDPALGMTAVIPDMDPTKPALVDPEKIIRPIVDQGVTNMFASPALLNRVGGYGKNNNVVLPSLKRVVSAGAPVLPTNIQQFSHLLTGEAQVHTPYGATEAVPIASIGSREILSETKALSEQGSGTCVGRPLEDIDIRIIHITDDPIEHWSNDLEVEPGTIGEIVVRGDLVTRRYFERPKEDAKHKIMAGNGFWHRMGDVGWRDDQGRIWFCGRKSHRVITLRRTMFTIPCEAVFNAHPQVFRSALVGVGSLHRKKPVMCIELIDGVKGRDQVTIEKELLDLGQKNELTREIDTILFHDGFPVDIRHNSKIFREKLALWAEDRLKD